MRSTRRLGSIKAKRRFWRWLRIVADSASEPLRDKASLLQFILLVGGLYVAFTSSDKNEFGTELVDLKSAIAALIWAVPIYVLVCAALALFRTLRDERAEGQWHGTSFVYREPKLVFMTRVTDADNHKCHRFTVEDAEPGGSVEMRVAFDGFEQQRIRVLVVSSAAKSELQKQGLSNPQEIMSEGERIFLSFVPSDRAFTVRSYSATCNPSIIKVYLISWNTN